MPAAAGQSGIDSKRPGALSQHAEGREPAAVVGNEAHCLTPSPLLPCSASLQEEIIPFFQKLTLSPDNKDVFSCYLELAEKVRWVGSQGGE